MDEYGISDRDREAIYNEFSRILIKKNLTYEQATHIVKFFPTYFTALIGDALKSDFDKIYKKKLSEILQFHSPEIE